MLCIGRRYVCRWVYSSAEAFARIMVQHAILGGDPSSFNWCEYATRMKRTAKSPTWFQLEPSMQMVVDDILQFASFDQVAVSGYPTNQRRTSIIARRVGAPLWMAFKLQHGLVRPKQFMLAPFEARGSREESAVRLALEAQRLRVPWDALAVRKVQDSEKDADQSVCSCTLRKRIKLQPCLS